MTSRRSDTIIYRSRNMMRGSSTADLIFLRNVTPSLPSIRRWSYVSATYIIGLISTYNTGARCDSCVWNTNVLGQRPHYDGWSQTGDRNTTGISLQQHTQYYYFSTSVTRTCAVHHSSTDVTRARTSLAHLAVDGDGPVEDAVHAEDG